MFARRRLATACGLLLCAFGLALAETLRVRHLPLTETSNQLLAGWLGVAASLACAIVVRSRSSSPARVDTRPFLVVAAAVLSVASVASARIVLVLPLLWALALIPTPSWHTHAASLLCIASVLTTLARALS